MALPSFPSTTNRLMSFQSNPHPTLTSSTVLPPVTTHLPLEKQSTTTGELGGLYTNPVLLLYVMLACQCREERVCVKVEKSVCPMGTSSCLPGNRYFLY